MRGKSFWETKTDCVKIRHIKEKPDRENKTGRFEEVFMAVKMTIDEFDSLMDTLEQMEMDDGGYIPSDEELTDYVEKHTDRYYLYLLWYSAHKPEPKNADEKRRLKRLTTAINNAVEILDEEETPE